MNDRMKEMYKSGGLLKALLKDPSQRKMAADMLASNSDSVVDGNAGRGDTKKYVAGGSVEERIKTMLGAPAGFNPGAKDQYAMGGKMDYGMGGSMKYRMGGNMPGEDEVVTEVMLDKIQSSPSGNFEMVGEDFLQQREEDISDSGKLLKFFAVKEAARMLDEEGISPMGMKPQELLSAARKKGLNPMRGAKDLFDREIDRRREI
jgi:hypothetical protein